MSILTAYSLRYRASVKRVYAAKMQNKQYVGERYVDLKIIIIIKKIETIPARLIT